LARSSSRRRIVTLDRSALGGLALGIALYVMPFWREGRLRAALWITLLSTLVHTFTSRERAEGQEPAQVPDQAGEHPR
jgi:hypothetical protein